MAYKCVAWQETRYGTGGDQPPVMVLTPTAPSLAASPSGSERGLRARIVHRAQKGGRPRDVPLACSGTPCKHGREHPGLPLCPAEGTEGTGENQCFILGRGHRGGEGGEGGTSPPTHPAAPALPLPSGSWHFRTCSTLPPQRGQVNPVCYYYSGPHAYGPQGSPGWICVQPLGLPVQ